LYANLNIVFFKKRLCFFKYIVSKKGIEIKEAMVKALKERPTHKTINEVKSFYGLASLYRRFVKDFSAITASLTKIKKKIVGFK
jgi:hypothetical protein